MRLLNAQTLELVESFGQNVPRYAILSHTWGEQEVTFADLQSGKYMKKRGYYKISNTLRRARDDKLEWAWIDTCCIDKSSSAELSEAINSMFAWYERAVVCYAFLEDVKHPDVFYGTFSSNNLSRWFSRGWTLRELIAPRMVEFFGMDWKRLCTRSDIAHWLSTMTGIDEAVLIDLFVWVDGIEKLHHCPKAVMGRQSNHDEN